MCFMLPERLGGIWEKKRNMEIIRRPPIDKIFWFNNNRCMNCGYDRLKHKTLGYNEEFIKTVECLACGNMDEEKDEMLAYYAL